MSEITVSSDVVEGVDRIMARYVELSHENKALKERISQLEAELSQETERCARMIGALNMVLAWDNEFSEFHVSLRDDIVRALKS